MKNKNQLILAFLLISYASTAILADQVVLVDPLDANSEVLVDECRLLSSNIRRKYWNFVDKADVIYSTVRKTDDKNECMFIYVNVVGSFFVIGD